MNEHEAELLITEMFSSANNLADVREWYSHIDEFEYNHDYQRMLIDDYNAANKRYDNAKKELMFHLVNSRVVYEERK